MEDPDLAMYINKVEVLSEMWGGAQETLGNQVMCEVS